MRRILWAVVLLAGCASVGRSMGHLVPGYGVTPQMQTTFCGGTAAWEKELEEAKAELKATGRQQPTPGMSACRVLARLGAPDDIRTVETETSIAAHWTYWEEVPYRGRVAHLVVMVPGPAGGAQVGSVVW